MNIMCDILRHSSHSILSSRGNLCQDYCCNGLLHVIHDLFFLNKDFISFVQGFHLFDEFDKKDFTGSKFYTQTLAQELC